MKAFLLALVALVVISVGANQILLVVAPTGAEAGTSAANVRLSD